MTNQANRLSLPSNVELSQLDPSVQAVLGLRGAMPTHQSDTPITVAQVCFAYVEYCKTYPLSDPQARGKAKILCDELIENSGSMQADEFGPVKLRALMITG